MLAFFFENIAEPGNVQWAEICKSKVQNLKDKNLISKMIIVFRLCRWETEQVWRLHQSIVHRPFYSFEPQYAKVDGEEKKKR